MMNNYEKLEKLLLQKDFEALSPEEKNWVQDFMSPQEYTAQRKVLQESKTVLAQKPNIPKGNLAALQSQLKAQHSKTFADYLTQPIPTYQVVLLMLLLGGLLWYLLPSKTIETTVEKKVYITKTDTLFKDKIVYKDSIVYKTKTQTKTIILPTPKPDTVYVPFANKELFYQDKKEPTQKGKGKTIKDLGNLMDFVTAD